MFSAGRTWNLMLFDEITHLFLCPSIDRAFQCNVFLIAEIFDQLICTETLMTFFTVHQRIRKASEMSGCYPGLRIHQDRTVNTYVVWILCDEFLPPCLFYIVLQLYTKITVIPGICQTSVNLGTRIYKTSGFCQCHDLVHCFFHLSPPVGRLCGICIY